MLIKLLNKVSHLFGIRIKVERLSSPFDIFGNESFMQIYNQCKPYTMTSPERMYSLYLSMNYIIDNRLEGDLAECGVWRGGSSMMMALMLKQKGITDKKIYLYDTYEGMSAPTEFDTTARGVKASTVMTGTSRSKSADSIWCYSPLDEVKGNLYSTGYPKENLFFVQGKVEDTLPDIKPGKLCMLRLDTDFYESTKIELEQLYPLLIEKGILIIDDFGHWDGVKKAVREYFEAHDHHPLLQRIDYTARMMIK